MHIQCMNDIRDPTLVTDLQPSADKAPKTTISGTTHLFFEANDQRRDPFDGFLGGHFVRIGTELRTIQQCQSAIFPAAQREIAPKLDLHCTNKARELCYQ